MGKINNTVDNATIKALAESGKSARQISKIVKTASHGLISTRLKAIMPKEDITFFKEHKADILAEKQIKLLNITANPKTKCKLDPADHKNLAIAFGVYEEREARLRGMSPDVKPLIVINKIVVGKQDIQDVVDVTPDGGAG